MNINDKIKQWLNENIWDGEDRSGSNDWVKFNPDELLEMVIDCLSDVTRRESEHSCNNIYEMIPPIGLERYDYILKNGRSYNIYNALKDLPRLESEVSRLKDKLKTAKLDAIGDALESYYAQRKLEQEAK